MVFLYFIYQFQPPKMLKYAKQLGQIVGLATQFFFNFGYKMSVDNDQTCLICATISSATLRKLSKFEWLRQELHKIAMCANTV